MSYDVEFIGGRQDGRSHTLDHKIGGYYRMRYIDKIVEVYTRTYDDDFRGVYTLAETGDENGPREGRSEEA